MTDTNGNPGESSALYTWRDSGHDFIGKVRAAPLPNDLGGPLLTHLCLLRCAHLLEQVLDAYDHGLDELALLALRPIIETAGYACYYHLEPDQYERAFISADILQQGLSDLVDHDFEPSGLTGKEQVPWLQAWEKAIEEGTNLAADELKFWYRASSNVAMHGGLAAVDRYVSKEGEVVSQPPLPVGPPRHALHETAVVFCWYAAIAIGFEIDT